MHALSAITTSSSDPCPIVFQNYPCDAPIKQSSLVKARDETLRLLQVHLSRARSLALAAGAVNTTSRDR